MAGSNMCTSQANVVTSTFSGLTIDEEHKLEVTHFIVLHLGLRSELPVLRTFV